MNICETEDFQTSVKWSLFYFPFFACNGSRSNLSAKVDQYVDVLREASVHADVEVDVRERLQCLLSSLITQNIHHRDIMDGKEHLLHTSLVVLWKDRFCNNGRILVLNWFHFVIPRHHNSFIANVQRSLVVYVSCG